MVGAAGFISTAVSGAPYQGRRERHFSRVHHLYYSRRPSMAQTLLQSAVSTMPLNFVHCLRHRRPRKCISTDFLRLVIFQRGLQHLCGYFGPGSTLNWLSERSSVNLSILMRAQTEGRHLYSADINSFRRVYSPLHCTFKNAGTSYP